MELKSKCVVETGGFSSYLNMREGLSTESPDGLS